MLIGKSGSTSRLMSSRMTWSERLVFSRGHKEHYSRVGHRLSLRRVLIVGVSNGRGHQKLFLVRRRRRNRSSRWRRGYWKGRGERSSVGCLLHLFHQCGK